MADTDFSTYDGLKLAIADELNRADLTERIPGWIVLAETRMFRELKLGVWANEITLTVGSDAPFVDLPADYLDFRYMLRTGTVPGQMTQMPVGVGQSLFAPRQGVSRQFDVVGNQMKLIPDAGEGDEFTLGYYAKPIPLSTSQQSNTLLVLAPDLYFYASLIPSAPFLGDDGRIATWSTLYERGADALRRFDNIQQFSAAPQMAIPFP